MLEAILWGAVGFFPLWGSFEVIRRARLALLVPAILLVMAAGTVVDVMHGVLADALNMHPKLEQDQIDSSERYLKAHPVK